MGFTWFYEGKGIKNTGIFYLRQQKIRKGHQNSKNDTKETDDTGGRKI